MLQKLYTSFKDLATDRLLLGLLIAVVALGVLLTIFVGVSIRPSEVQVVTHYTSFGPTNFYRTSWTYLLTFAVFGLLYALSHALIALKLFAEKGRSFALGFLLLSLSLILVAFAITGSIINIATL